MKNNSKLKICEIIFSIFSFIYCFKSNTENGYDIIFLMPMVYIICRIFFRFDIEDYKFNIAYVMIDLLTFIKYSLMPLLVVIMQDYYGGVLTAEIPSTSYIKKAIILLCIECVSVFIVTFIYKKVNKNREEPKYIKEKNKFGPIMFIFVCIALMLVLIYSSSFFPKQLFVIDSDYKFETINSSLDGLIEIIFFLLKLVTMLYIMQFFYFRYQLNGKFYNIIGIILTLLTYLAFNTSTSRWILVIPVIVVIYILSNIWFKNHTNKIALIIIMVVLGISFVSISMYKFNWLFKGSEISLKDVTTVLASQIQEYISGPRAVAQGIETIEVYRNKISYATLFNDFAGSIPFISHFINQKDRINIYYNYFLKGENSSSTQIMPMITIGLAYFSEALCYLFTIIFIWLSLKMGNIAAVKSDIHRKYIYSYLSVWCVLCLGFNTQIIFAWIVSNFIPFILLMCFDSIIKMKRR